MLQTVVAVSSLIISIISILATVYLAGIRFAKLEVKVDTMWSFQMRRAFSEVIEKGVGSMNSPLKIQEAYILKLNSIKPQLRKLYEEKFHTMSKKNFLIEIERKFGSVLLNEICIPCKLTHGACLIIAMAVARDTDSLDIEKLF